MSRAAVEVPPCTSAQMEPTEQSIPKNSIVPVDSSFFALPNSLRHPLHYSDNYRDRWATLTRNSTREDTPIVS